MTTRNPVVVIGGGLAGIAAAVRLAQHHLPVTLVETRKRLGGRATSFTDPASGKSLDNCQHVLLGCCTNLIDLYHHLGVADRIHWHNQIHFATPKAHPLPGVGPPATEIDPSYHLDTLEADDLPAPLHMTAALLRFRGLTLPEKIAISRAMFAIMRLGREGRKKLHHTSFAQWLDDHRQPAEAIARFWAPVVISAVNELPHRMAADYAIQVFQDGFLSSDSAYRMGLAAVPLVDLYDAAESVITRAGGTLLLSTSAHRLLYENHRVTALLIDDNRTLNADAFISALPPDRLAKIAPAELIAADPRLTHLDQFEFSPILGIHLFFEDSESRPVMTLPHLVLTHGPLQWLFNKGRCSPDEIPATSAETSSLRPQASSLPTHLHGVISAAHDLVDQPAEHIINLALAQIRQVLPAARSARLLHAKVIKEKRATFSALPGVDRLRPPASLTTGQAGPESSKVRTSNLYLAGDWTDTAWPATMEGAVRSGYLAATALLSDLAPASNPASSPALIPDLPTSPLYSLLSR